MSRHLSILGLRPGASPHQIKAAYRALARRWHPDRFQGEWERERALQEIRRINVAYDWLSRRCRTIRSAPRSSQRAPRPFDLDRRSTTRVSDPCSRRRKEVQDLVGLLFAARAEIVWGKPPRGVVASLLRKDVPAELARAAVDHFLEERDASRRAKGRRDILAGSSLFCLGATLCAVSHSASGLGGWPVVAIGIPLLGLPGMYAGFWLFMRGRHRLRHGGRREERETIEF